MSIEEIRQRFQEGERVVVIKHNHPVREYRRLYKQAARRGYSWHFATLAGEIFVTERK